MANSTGSSKGCSTGHSTAGNMPFGNFGNDGDAERPGEESGDGDDATRCGATDDAARGAGPLRPAER